MTRGGNGFALWGALGLAGLLVPGCSESVEPPKTAPQAPEGPGPVDTLSALQDLPELYGADPRNLAPRYAAKLVKGSRDGVRFAIARFRELGEAAVPEILRILEPRIEHEQEFGVLLNGFEALRATGTKSTAARDLALRALHHKSGSVVADAARTLGAIGDAAALTQLRELVLTAGVEQRRLVIQAIGKLEGEEADRALHGIVLDRNVPDGLRWEAAQALAVRPAATALPYWKGLLDQPLPVGATAAIALAGAGDADGMERARRLAEDLSPPTPLEVASLASSALVKAGDPGPALAALRHADPQIRLAVGLVAIRSLFSDPPPKGPEPPIPLEPRLEKALRRCEADPSPLVRVEAMRLLVRFGRLPSTEGELEDLATEDPVRVARALEILTDPQIADRRATPILIGKLQRAPNNRKRGFLQALGRLRDPAAAPVLGSLLTSPGDFLDGAWLQEYAARQITNVGVAGVHELERALEAVRDPWQRRLLVEGLATSTEAASRPILRAIAERASEESEVRAVAIRNLPLCEGGAAAPFLKRLLETESDPRLRRLLNATLFEYY